MSFHGTLTMFRMNDGTFQVVMIDHDPESHAQRPGESFKTYEEAVTGFDAYFDRIGYQPNVGGDVPSLDELLADPARFVGSTVQVLFGDRQCECFFEEDLAKPEWKVIEIDHTDEDDGETRVIAEGISYAKAINIVHSYAPMQPGYCTVRTPSWFQENRGYHRYDCVAMGFPDNDPDCMATETEEV